MKIGIDAKWFFEGPPSGKYVIENLVENLIKINNEHDLFIILDKRSKGKNFPFKDSKVNLEYVWADNNLISNLFVLPGIAKKLNLDSLVFQNFSSLTGNFKRIAYIHDILFLSHPQFYTIKERLYFSPLRFLANHSNLVITVSEAEKQRLIQYKLKTKIKVVHHGVNKVFKERSRFEPDYIDSIIKKYGLPDKFILYVGRLNVRKNIFNLLNAIPEINKDVPLVIVGAKDWKIFDVEKQVNDLKISDRLKFVGPVFGKELAAIYSLATVFCFPSYAESFGLPALEAMSAGVPIVVSNTTSLPEVCGEAGNYINPNDPGQIALMINNLLNDPILCKAKSNQGLVQAKCFSWERAAKELLENIVRE